MHAVAKFDETQDVKFATYAVWWVRQRCSAALIKQKYVVTRPMNLKSAGGKGKLVVSEPLVRINIDGEEEERDIAVEDPEQDLMGKRYLERMLNDGKASLTPRQRLVLKHRFEDGLSLNQIGEKWDLSRERIRQIEQQALFRLRRNLDRSGFEGQ